MRKKSVDPVRMYAVHILFVLMFFLLIMQDPHTTSADAVDVTDTYRQRVGHYLSCFDNYLGVGTLNNMHVQFDSYCRTMMAYMSGEFPYDTEYSEIHEELASIMHILFGTGADDIRFVPFVGYRQELLSPSYLFQLDGDSLRYVSGNWGDTYPRGIVDQVIQTDQTHFVVKYRIRYFGYAPDYPLGQWWGSNMGSYEIELERVRSRLGFRITDLRQRRLFQTYD